MSCCGKLGAALKKIFNALRPLLAVALLCVAAYFLFLAPAGATVGSVFGSVPWMPLAVSGSAMTATTAGYVALGAAVLVDAEGIGGIVGDAAGAVARTAGAVVAAAIGGAASGLFGGDFLPLALGAFVLYLFFTRKKDEDKSGKSDSDESSRDDGDSRASEKPNVAQTKLSAA